MNAAEQYAHFKLVREKVWNATASVHDPYAAVFALFNAADDVINQSIKVYRRVDTSQSITTSPSDLLYNFPGDILGNHIFEKGIQFVYSDGIESISPIDPDRARGLFGDFTNPNSKTTGERFWWPSEFDPGQFYIAWPATKGGTLRITYLARTTHPLSASNAIYGGSSSIHIDVLNGSKAVTMNATPASSLFALDTDDNPLFQIGLGQLGTLPSKWYDVDTVTIVAGNITGLALKENYLEPTATSQRFVAAQRSDIARHLKSERDGFLPVWWALGTLMEVDNPQAAESFRNRFDTRLLAAAPFNPHLQMRSGPKALTRASFGRPRAG